MRPLYRIVCVGGSTTVEGWTDKSTYPARLEAVLANRALGQQRMEVINAGVSGNNSSHLKQNAQRYRVYDPDLIIHYNGINDVVWHYFRVMRLSLSPWREFLLRSHIVRKHMRFLAKWDEALMQSKIRQRTFVHYRDFVETMRASNVTVVFCSFAFPNLNSLTALEYAMLEVEFQIGWRGSPFSLRDYCKTMELYNTELADFARNEGLIFYRIADQVTGGTEIFVDICHMTDRGIMAKAEVVVEHVLRSLEASQYES